MLLRGQDEGTIEIRITLNEDQRIRLVQTDNGCGFPADFDVNEKETLGLTLVDTLCDQLEGECSFENTDQGTRFVLEFTKVEPQPQVPT